jgi:hypothetical protein
MLITSLPGRDASHRYCVGYTALITQNICTRSATEPGKVSQSGGVVLRTRAQVDRRRTHSPKPSGKQRMKYIPALLHSHQST